MNHIGGHMGTEESGPEGGGVDVVEASFDVQEEGGDLQLRALESPYIVHEGEASVGGAEP